jgi:hypothetical protein
VYIYFERQHLRRHWENERASCALLRFEIKTPDFVRKRRCKIEPTR